MKNLTNQGLLSLTMALVMLAPVQPPLIAAPPVAARPGEHGSPLRRAGIAAQVAAALPGQSITMLPDGSTLVLGGLTAAGSAGRALLNGQVLSKGLQHARAYHTATVLPDGTVFIFGGSDGNALITQAELFDPITQSFSPVTTDIKPRTNHTATLLTNGQVLISGGVLNGGTTDSIELWDPVSKSSVIVPTILAQARRDHKATIQADGTVRIEGGVMINGSPATITELFNSDTESISGLSGAALPDGDLQLAAALPADGSKGVALDALVAMRFSRIMKASSLNTASVTMQSPNGAVAAKVSAAEAGRLAFIVPTAPLEPGTLYTLSINGATDMQGSALLPVQISFTTIGQSSITGVSSSAGTKTVADPEDPALPALQAGPGVTALAGQVMTVSGKYLQGVSLVLDCGGKKDKRAVSDGTGRFLIANVPSGHCELEVDGTTVRRGSDSYGIFEPGVDIAAGITNVIPYTIWMTPLDTAHAVTIPSPTPGEFVVTSPLIPNLELHLPPGAVVKDYDGNVLHQLSITRISLARPPFPLPAGVGVNFYFTIQPGGAYVEVNGAPAGAQLYYPNQNRAPAGFKMNFWNYDPDAKGWYIYGNGKVDANRRYVIPDPGVTVYEFTGAMVAGSGFGGGGGPGSGAPGGGPGDPVDPGTGIFMHQRTDLYLPDVLPITLNHTYRQWDPLSHAFGVGMTNDMDMFLVGDTFPYTYADLILPDGSKVHFVRTSPHQQGLGDYMSAVYQPPSEPSFFGSQIAWNGTGWTLTQKDGTTWKFRDGFNATVPAQGGLISITDRYGNTTTMNRDTVTGNLTKVISPNGRYIAFTYDSANRVTQAVDNSGRTVHYFYDPSGRLIEVDNPLGGSYKYSYDAYNQMLTMTDSRQLPFVTNHYDTSGRVIEQDLATGTWLFAYTQDANGNIIQTDVTNPRGKIRRYTFNTNGYFSGGKTTSEIFALGLPEQQTVTFQYQSGTNLLLSTTDGLGRITNYTYDTKGNVQSVTRAVGTPDAATTSYTYDPNFNRVTSITDPLQHTTTFAIDPASGKMASSTDPLGYQVSFTYNSAGQPSTVSDSAGSTTFTYTQGLLGTISDSLGNTTQHFYDSAGRLIQKLNPAGGKTTYVFDAMNQVIQVTDPIQAITNFLYDPNGNLQSVTDARQHPTTYTYTNMDQVQTRTDALQKGESRTYDLNGNLSTSTDRKGQITQYTYDALDRLTQLQYADQSTTIFTYDAGNRATQIVDASSGTITRTYDNLDRLTSETTPQGSISYTVDAAGRRTSMTVSGQPIVTYTYDIANKLTQIAQGSSTVVYAYDSSNRISSLTLPNGIVRSYGYDGASRVISLSYSLGSTSLGNLTYAYDADGRRTSAGGSLASTSLPSALNSATYNSNNQLTQWNAMSPSYDFNGNMTSDGINSFSWDARNRLFSMNSSGFAYDASGRRSQNAAGTRFLYDGANAVQELSGSTVTANLLTGLGTDQLFNRVDASGNRTFVRDALGSTIALTDNSGAVQTQYSYGPFGLTTTSGATSSNPFQYTGRENDGTGIYYYRARYYDPTLQRFISEDPAGMAGSGSNLYGYAGNSPTNMGDPLGLWSPLAHDALIQHALGSCGVPQSEIDTIKQSSRIFDWVTQSNDQSYKHSMLKPGQSDPEFFSQRNRFIQDSIASALKSYESGNLTGALSSLAMAQHDVADSLSPAHMIDGHPLTWCHKVCDGSDNHTPGWPLTSESSGKEGLDKLTSADYDFMDAYLQGAYSFTTGKKLACRYPSK